ncbi:MAG: 50S ribosomal protein L18 [Armatimonadota bacterium]|nr:50S ribosomal protein L18 [Armatimonadota bacterium]MDR7401389.1 50S ribosomal protein L18 [Armatimonadota bacterium]MDR7404714.1 50S ribosomal protein L18 [Armatimonadota bacterium]MDR7437937.1 50S ribosomal protein L18 [Armatimonadota bacterium]MDR7473345.1 50S ribosomal protein L18 [Armatimonadota bacterium]
MIKRVDRNVLRQRRHARIRRRIAGTGHRPRLSVFRSLKHIYAQIIDDDRGMTLAAASTLDPEVRDQVRGKRKTEAAAVVGEILARRARARGIVRVVFDRGGYKYHGRVRALAEGARRGGLEF